MDITEVVSATNYFFPNNYGIILTGSQRYNKVFKKESDIDIIVLDSFCCNVYSKSKEKDSYRIDYTVLPITDIANVFDNNLHNTKAVLFSMLSNGICLHNPFLIIEPLQKRAKIIFDAMCFKSCAEYERYLNELIKLKMLFRLPMLPVEKLILLSDFTSFISILETIRLNNWICQTKQKIRFLQKKAPEFLEKIKTLVEKANRNEFEDIIAYISFYHQNFTSNRLLTPQQYYQLVVEINYANFSLSNFVIEIFPALIENENLKRTFQYFYLSPTKYKYKYKRNVNLVFRIVKEEECLQLIKLINAKINLCKNKTLQYGHFCEINEYGELKDCLNDLNVTINKRIIKLINKDKDFDREKIIDIFFKLCFFLKNCFLPNSKDFRSVNSFIWQKWLVTPDEQQRTNSRELLMQIIVSRINEAEHFYKNNMTMLLQTVLADNITLSKTEVHFNEIFSMLENIAMQKEKFIIPENDINAVIFTNDKFPDMKSAWIYKLIIESMFLVLNISDNEKLYCLYACTKASIEVDEISSNKEIFKM